MALPLDPVLLPPAGIASEYSVKCSYLELYNEEITDLLAVGSEVPKVRVAAAGGPSRPQGMARVPTEVGAACSTMRGGTGSSTRVQPCWPDIRALWLAVGSSAWRGCMQQSAPAASAVPPQVRIMEDRSGVVLAGIEESVVANSKEIFVLLEQGSAKRRTAETLLNKQSSRSHSGGPGECADSMQGVLARANVWRATGAATRRSLA